ncbi:16S rRNA (cytosine(1402)-N(4))-methyltransferase RsmH [Psittacicella hinzii]|uniref:Ribosomal RNA small subunit methyltransferase H n=1 Tax=Psittacicella hinzii TaxID=2028575 RepID=A0A3A1YNX8_9GAMM|nr:16S rRNA (cytosine(1402)-N(4))-methyltransferase RsmH [Psittacicella hinzii]RIY38660.1 16S rRNA (cytosine(1402)-N(4))-methyltransferase [Psittacicella hinzii]
MSQEFSHTTVMLHEAVEALDIKPEGIYIDGTFGRGGHSSLILSKLNAQGRLIAFDRDEQAIAVAKQINDPRLTLVHSEFSSMATYAKDHGLEGKIDGILLDLGVSSPQLDDASRGFSFMHKGPLDMRMNQHAGLTAREWLYQNDEKTIADVLWLYGEEKNSRQIARAICERKNQVSFEEFLPDTDSLVQLIKQASRKIDKNKNPATRSFQAIRIAVNDELGELERVLQSSLTLLKTDGRLSIISFHSLEDRLVKQFFKQQHQGKPIPKYMPILDEHWDSEIYYSQISKALKPSQAEIEVNPRSRSAVLRWAQRSALPVKNN